MSIWSRIERTLGEIAGDLLPDEFREQLTDARRHLDDGHPDEAADLVEAMLAARPEHPGALALLGAARLELGDDAAARAAFERSIAADPERPGALLGLGQACIALGELDTALQSFRATVDLAGGDRALLALAYRGLGVTHRRRGDLDKAIRELRKAVAEDPRDALARAALGDALLADEAVSAEEARRHLWRATELDDPPAQAFLSLGQLALEEANVEVAVELLSQGHALAIDREDVQAQARALTLLGDAALIQGEPDRAVALLCQAVDRAPKLAGLHARLGDAYQAQGETEAALRSYRRAIELGAGKDVLGRALNAAILAGETAAAVGLANQMLQIDSQHPRALIARGMALVAGAEFEAARATFAEVLATRDDAEAHVALGRLALGESPTAEAGRAAAGEALAALRLDPRNPRARALLAQGRERELVAERGDATDPGGGVASEGMYVLAMDLHRLAVARSELGGLAPHIAQAASDFDQALLVTVMGEFSSGKSTFVNAFIGSEVAPTGITPTTATINVLKHGRERGGRILYHNGNVETLAWADMLPTLREIGPERAKKISTVEILLPLDDLERVSIVDTPGLNSILPEHEQVARGFIARADAVVWLFTANQAGKASERKALQRIRDEGVRVLGVLNKIDQLSDDDAAEVVEHVSSELGDLVEVVVPISARQALDRTDGEDGEDGEDGNWAQLSSALEQRFFAQARPLKLQAANRRLGNLLGQARGAIAEHRDRAASAASQLRTAAEAIATAREQFIDDVVKTERRNLAERVADLYRQAAREVLDLVRPRKLPFGSHKATAADRDYLISLLETGFEAALEPSRRAVMSAMTRATAPVIAGLGAAVGAVGDDRRSELDRAAGDAIRLLDAQVFARCQAYLRGYLHGGCVDAFFRLRLPKLELEEDSVYHALFRDSPDLDAQISVPLASAGLAALDKLCDRLHHLADVADVLVEDIDVGVARALEAIDQRRRELAG